jgi:DNA (cytosine-5)-methyltransferase 1
MKLVSLFSGAGGLDLGFEKAGFKTVFANEYDRTIWSTFSANFPDAKLDQRSIVDIAAADVPEADGLIGGPPCQSWSEAGAHRGIEDQRGQLFYEYIRILRHVKPRFFLAENVSGIVSSRHRSAFEAILERFGKLGYRVCHRMLRASDFGVPQDRDRVIVVGIRKDLRVDFEFPEPIGPAPTLRQAIGEMPQPLPNPSLSARVNHPRMPNHEYLVGGFSSIYMSRNRVRTWSEPSFTIQAGARHAPLHPKAPRMEKVGVDKFRFVPGNEGLYRRLSVRECARIQTFPDSHKLCYDRIIDGYKMIGNAVPVNLAFHLATAVEQCISKGLRRRRAGRKAAESATGSTKRRKSRVRGREHPSLFDSV